jgi:hypothetical protein
LGIQLPEGYKYGIQIQQKIKEKSNRTEYKLEISSSEAGSTEVIFGSLVVIMFAIGPKAHGFKPGQG